MNHGEIMGTKVKMGGGDLGIACPTVNGTELWKSVRYCYLQLVWSDWRSHGDEEVATLLKQRPALSCTSASLLALVFHCAAQSPLYCLFSTFPMWPI